MQIKILKKKKVKVIICSVYLGKKISQPNKIKKINKKQSTTTHTQKQTKLEQTI